MGNKSEFCSGAVEQRRKCLKIPVDSIKPFEDCILYLSHADSFVSECRMNLAYSIIMKQMHSHSEGQGRPDCGLWLAAKRERSHQPRR